MKGSDDKYNLLEYIVRRCCRQEENFPNASLPVPEPTDIHQCSNVSFEDIQKEMHNISNSLANIKVGVGIMTTIDL
jgi:hypothetical protein